MRPHPTGDGEVTAVTGAPEITPASRVDVGGLAMRRDGDEWIIGRVDAGSFVAAPAVARDALDLLGRGLTVADTQTRLARATGTEVDVADLVATLAEVGLVRSVDGRPVDGPPVPEPSLGWLRPHHVSWLLHPAVAAGGAVLVVAAAGCLVWRPGLLPAHRDLIWSRHQSVVVLGNAAIAWTIVLAHELGHLLTARAAGVPGRIGLSTRLQFLVAQTDVSGVWASPRRVRLTVYLAGIAVNLLIAAAGVLVLAAGPEAPVGRVTAAAVLLSLLFVPWQLLVFMRTDLYFVLQDLTRCRNLYGDAVAHARRRITRQAVPAHEVGTTGPSRREQRVVRCYCLLMVVGTVLCLGLAVTVTLPVAAAVLGTSLQALVAGGSPTERLDAAAVLVTTAGVHVLWVRAWWRRHGRPRFRPSEGVPAKEGGEPCSPARPRTTGSTRLRPAPSRHRSGSSSGGSTGSRRP